VGRIFESLDDTLRAWIAEQPMFFVATAPRDAGGHVNLSPKGARGAFQVLGPSRCAYLDLVGSGIETVAHLRENGRVTVMFCAFAGPPKVLRLYGHGQVVQRHHQDFDELVEAFAPPDDLRDLVRSVITIGLTRISDSCGFVVPQMEFSGDRQHLMQWGERQASRHGNGWKDAFLAVNNQKSIDGLDGLDLPDLDPELADAEKTRFSSDGKAL